MLSGLGAVQALVTGQDVPALADFTRYTGVGSITPLAVIAVVVGVGWAGWHLPFFWLVETFRSFGPLAVGWFVSMLAASVVLAHLYCAGGRSILLVAAWHTAFNFTSATEATGAVVGTVMSVAVIGWAIWVLRRPELYARKPAR